MRTGEAATGSTKNVLQELFSRVSPLEKGQERLDAEIKGLRGEIGEIKDMLRALSGRINRGTDWPLLLSWAGLILAIGKMAADPMVERIESLERDREKAAVVSERVARMEERTRIYEMEGWR